LWPNRPHCQNSKINESQISFYDSKKGLTQPRLRRSVRWQDQRGMTTTARLCVRGYQLAVCIPSTDRSWQRDGLFNKLYDVTASPPLYFLLRFNIYPPTNTVSDTWTPQRHNKFRWWNSLVKKLCLDNRCLLIINCLPRLYHYNHRYDYLVLRDYYIMWLAKNLLPINM